MGWTLEGNSVGRAGFQSDQEEMLTFNVDEPLGLFCLFIYFPEAVNLGPAYRVRNGDPRTR